MKLSSAVITGATGMIGINLINRLLGDGVRVLALVRPHSSNAARLPKQEGLTVLECGLCDLPKAKGRISGRYDAFFHLGWDGTFGDSRNDMALQTQNIRYTLDAVDLAKQLGCQVFVGAGSQAEYGRVTGSLSADTPAFPENGYGIAKLCAGQMSRIACRQRGIRHVWARILSVYGTFEGPNTMVMSSIRTLLKGECPLFTGSEQMWDYLFSEDAANGLYLMAQKGLDGAVYCLGSGRARPLREYIEALRDAVDPSLPVGIGALPYAQNQVMYLCADIASLTKDTGFVPQVPFEEGIKRTVEWCKKECGR